MQTEILMVRDSLGNTALGTMTHLGFMPFVVFSSIEELRGFGQGILSFCDTVSPPVPEVFLAAFEEDSNG